MTSGSRFCSRQFCFYLGFVNFVFVLCSCSLFSFVWFSVLVLVDFCLSTQPPKFWKIIKSVKKLMKTRSGPWKKSLKRTQITTNWRIICWNEKKREIAVLVLLFFQMISMVVSCFLKIVRLLSSFLFLFCFSITKFCSSFFVLVL